MKHLNLKVSIEDNELFEEELAKALKAHAKQIARESLNEELSKEIDRISKKNLENLATSNWYNPIRDKVAESVHKKFSEEFNLQNEQFKSLLEEKIVAALGKKIDSQIEGVITHLINKSLAIAIQSYLKES